MGAILPGNPDDPGQRRRILGSRFHGADKTYGYVYVSLGDRDTEPTLRLK